MCRQDVDPKVEPQSHLLDLLDVNLGGASAPSASADPWGMPQSHPPPLPRQVRRTAVVNSVLYCL